MARSMYGLLLGNKTLKGCEKKIRHLSLITDIMFPTYYLGEHPRPLDYKIMRNIYYLAKFCKII